VDVLIENNIITPSDARLACCWPGLLGKKVEDKMVAIVAQETKNGFTAKKMVDAGRDIPVAFYPTGCRTFKTFDEAQKAAQYLSEEMNLPFVNMR